jgi:hypothetical protein
MINLNFLRIGLLSILFALLSTSANAVPAFARKYGTACQTCHTVFPKLNSFGEAFRRNGYLFPGNDSNFPMQHGLVRSHQVSLSPWDSMVVQCSTQPKIQAPPWRITTHMSI